MPDTPDVHAAVDTALNAYHDAGQRYQQAAEASFVARALEAFPQAVRAEVTVILDESWTEREVKLFDEDDDQIDTGDWPDVHAGEDTTEWWITVSEGICVDSDRAHVRIA